MPVTLPPQEAYRLWAPAWETDPSAIVALESRFLAPWLSELSGKVVADLGCGTGRWLSFAQSRGAQVFGVDFCLEMLAVAQKKAGLSGRLAQADVGLLPLRDSCADVVLSALTLGHVSSLETAVAELARLVRPAGRLLISDFHPAAVERGWKRTFRSSGESYEIESRPYAKDQLLNSAAKHGLVLEECIEPGFGEPERSIFDRAGKPELFDQVRDVPAVLVARWSRP